MQVLIVDDHPVLAESFAAALRGSGLDAEVARAATPGEVVDLAREADPALVLLDLDLGALGDGRDLIAPLADDDQFVVVLTAVTDPLAHAECLEAGARGVLTKDTSFERLIEGVREAAEGQRPLVSEARRQQLLADLRKHRHEEAGRLAAFERLTPTEARTLAALMDGLSAEEMSQAWYVAITTVRSHIRSVLRKLDVGSQLAAVAKARQADWQPPGS